MYCRHCFKQIEDDRKVCPYCGKKIFKQINIDDIKRTIVGTVKQARKRPARAAAFIIAFVLVLAFLSHILYSVKVNTLLDKSLGSASRAEQLCDLTYLVWYDTIHENYRSETAPYTHSSTYQYFDDFNSSLRKLYDAQETLEKLIIIEFDKKEIDKVYKSLNSPLFLFKKNFQYVEGLYDAYCRLYNFAVSPSGSLNTYGDNVSALSDSFLENYRKLDLLFS